MIDLTAVIITKNEEKNISKCLDSLGWIKEIVIIDDFSQDKTKETALKYPQVKFYENKFIDFSQQRNFATSKATNEWILSIDADETIPEDLAIEIKSVLSTEQDYSAFKIPTKNLFFGKWLKYGGWYPDYHIRLFKKTKAVWKDSVHETVDYSGRVGCLKNPIYHTGHETIEDSFRKILRDIPSEALLRHKKGIKFSIVKLIFDSCKTFINRYFLKVGFCDGIEGLVVAINMAIYKALIWLKLWEISKPR